MKRHYLMKTERIGFSIWQESDLLLAKILWSNPQVTKYIYAHGIMNENDIENRLHTEIENERNDHVQYWPIFELSTEQLMGCCGLRKHDSYYEIGFHLLPQFWHQGFAFEAANAVINYAFSTLKTKALFAGHHPDNNASQRLLKKLHFEYIKDEYYQPTGLYHPSYILYKEL